MLKKIINLLKKFTHKTDKKTIILYCILRILVIVCLIREIIRGDYLNALVCLLSLILFLLPALVENVFKVDLPPTLEISILIFVFAAEILGEINSFYINFKYFDLALHTISGFLCASVGFSLIYLLNQNIKTFNLSSLFATIVAFCFSMTMGICWELFEYGADKIVRTDMQKDSFVYKIDTVELDPTKSNDVVNIDNIDKTVVYDKNGNLLATFNGYLDIGLNDTMEDLIVNFIGAFVYSIFGYIYIKNEKKDGIAGKFMITKNAI